MPELEKMDLTTPDFVGENIAKLAELFPNCVTEKKNEQGEIVRAIDFDILRQELSDTIVDGIQERYQLNWPGKRKALVTANTPISKTLRPCRDESVDFDTTKNIFIEGDNLDALKLLQESYLGKIKMIYIDPPYNTGKDFIYNDNFKMDKEEYDEASGQRDEEGGRLVANPDSNGRFHSDWLSMMYPRLKLARNLLREDGVIFISIDDNEQANLKRLCDEIFGEDNFVSILPTIMNLKGNNDQFGFSGTHEFTIVYTKLKKSMDDLNGIPLEIEDMKGYNCEDEKGVYKQGATLMRTGEAGAREKRPKGYYPIYVSSDLSSLSIKREHKDDIEVYPKTIAGRDMSWRRSPSFLHETRSEFIIKKTSNGISFYKKQRLVDDKKNGKKAKSLFYKPEYSSGNGTAILKKLFQDRIFDNPKPIKLISDFVSIGSNPNDLILDFFAGSGTTAHAVMQLNAEDGGNRKCISVQLPELTDEKSEAFKAGYKNIAEISKERIRRAGKKIKEDNADKEGIKNLDIGFRVFKIDSSNMVDVARSPDKTTPKTMDMFVKNIKDDRSSEDLLFQVLLDWGVDLSLPIERQEIEGKEVFFVDGNALAACFEEGIDKDFVHKLADKKPLRVVFRDDGFASDDTKINVEQIFKLKSPTTDVKVI